MTKPSISRIRHTKRYSFHVPNKIVKPFCCCISDMSFSKSSDFIFDFYLISTSGNVVYLGGYRIGVFKRDDNVMEFQRVGTRGDFYNRFP
jgi:hypothetical protein